MAERVCRWPFWRAWASSGLYVRVALLPRSPSRQMFKHLFCVYDTEEEIKRPPGDNEEEKKKKTRSDSEDFSGKMERESRSGTGFRMTASRWLPWAWVVRSRIPRSQAGKRVCLLQTQQDQSAGSTAVVRGLVVPWEVGSSQTRDGSCVSCIGK